MVQGMYRNTQSEVHRNFLSCIEIKFVSNGINLFNQILVLLGTDKYGDCIERSSCPLHQKVRQNGFQCLCVHDKQNPYLNVLLAQERSNQPLRVLQFSGAIEEAGGMLSPQQCPERSLVFISLAAPIPLLVYTFTSNHTELCDVKSELNNAHYSLNCRSIQAHI